MNWRWFAGIMCFALSAAGDAPDDDRTRAEILQVVDAVRPRVAACGTQPMTVHALIDVRASGEVTRAQLAASSGSTKVDECVLSIVRALHFSRGRDTQIGVPFKLGP
jgi:TonB family protein